ncbi:hypothetical protein M1116_03980 [Patescibacteria group bacterium]|nr:hypothetical protein [Patescibacteria group bacterium]
MTEVVSCQQRFVERYRAAYSLQPTYYLLGHEPLPATSSVNFCRSRTALLDALLTTQPDTITFPHALLAEYVTALSLEPLLTPWDHRVDLAPQSLEHGRGQRGVDLLIRNAEDKIMLGIDVKLKSNRSRHNQNGGAWLDNLKAPYINLTLGNWEVVTREGAGVKGWLINCVLPNVPESGKIPHLDELRAFLVPRIKNSLVSQLEISRSGHPHPWYHLPESRQERIVYRQKLEGMIEIFGQIEARRRKDYN